MKSLFCQSALSVALLGSFAEIGNAQPQRGDLSTIAWRQPYGLRGQTIPLTIRLMNTGQPLTNQRVRFWDRSDNYGSRFLAEVVTDGSGYARLPYYISSSPLVTNVMITAKYDPYWSLPPGWITFISSATAEVRVQIGRQYP